MPAASRIRLVAVALPAVAALWLGSARADSSQPFSPRQGAVAGLVPALGTTGVGPQTCACGSGSVTYHGGPVMRTNTTYAVFWAPPGHAIDSGYEAVIRQWLADVAHDSGQATNVYSVDAQYYDTSTGSLEPGAYDATYGGYTVATDPLPSSDCVDPGTTVCIDMNDLEAELQSVIEAKGWPENDQTLYFLFTPQGVGSCTFSTSCAYTQYCAYHTAFGAGDGVIAWADQPYAAQPGCDPGQRPNSSPADATINVASHEHNEAITDPELDAWYDAQGNEIGDRCSWDFGALSGSAGSLYNQTINGHHYLMQQEFDNASKSCVQKEPQSGKPSISVMWPDSGGVGSPVALLGSGLGGATAVRFGGQPAAFTVAAPNLISTAVPAGAASGSIQVVTPHGTIASPHSFVVLASTAVDVEPGFGGYACALLAGGGVACWGSEELGQLGDGIDGFGTRSRPVAVKGLQHGVESLATDGNHSCVVLTGGTAKCWGDNTSGQLGDGTRVDRSTPVAVKGLTHVRQIDPVSDDQTCAIVASSLPGLAGGVKCWGANGDGGLGTGTTKSSLTPVTVAGLSSGVAQISGTCALRVYATHVRRGTVECWGPSYGMSPVPVQGVGDIVGLGGSCGVRGDATVECWSSADSGPTRILGLRRVQSIGAESSLSGGCALLESGDVDCWDEVGNVFPIVGFAGNVVQVGGLSYQGCATLDTGQAECWGFNEYGQLGDGTTDASGVPVLVAGL